MKLEVVITDEGGREDRIALSAAGNLMEALRDAGIPILADCGGACACATCHIYVDLEWQDRLPPMDDFEVSTLELAGGIDERSRLACQIPVTPELDGLSLMIAPDARY